MRGWSIYKQLRRLVLLHNNFNFCSVFHVCLRRRLEHRSTHPDGLLNIVLIRAERLLEHGRELDDLALERALVLPREPGVEDLPGDTLDALRDRDVEHVKVLVFGRRVGQLARVDCVDDAPRVLERAPAARAVLAARPAGVDQPAVGFRRSHTFREHGGVARGLQPGVISTSRRVGIKDYIRGG